MEEKKRNRDNAIGKRDALLARMKREFGVSNIGSAKKKLEEMKKERNNLMEEFEEKMEYLRENYEV